MEKVPRKVPPPAIPAFIVPQEIPSKMVMDLMCTAFEGGIAANWARCVAREGGKKAKYSHEVPFFGGYVLIKDIEEKDAVYKLDREAIERGLKTMAEKYPKHFGDFMSENDDAITGDVFLQCCLLGKIVYG